MIQHSQGHMIVVACRQDMNSPAVSLCASSIQSHNGNQAQRTTVKLTLLSGGHFTDSIHMFPRVEENAGISKLSYLGITFLH